MLKCPLLNLPATLAALAFLATIIAAVTLTIATPVRAQETSYDDAYDPFADYSEFEEYRQEEADIHFFRNGRFFNIGLFLGSRMGTDVLRYLYSTAPAYGLFATYFFDLRFALQLSYFTGDHRFSLYNDAKSWAGNISMTQMGLGVKYYFNTQNVTKGLAPFNPYAIVGLSMFNRTWTMSDGSNWRDGAKSFDIGAGAEVPFAENSLYVGLQIVYHYVGFPDENVEIKFDDESPSGVYPRGDIITILGLIGINF